MNGSTVKRGVEATLERIFKSSGQQFGKLAFHWTGTTAGINFQRHSDEEIDATLVFPNIDETAAIPNGTFSNLIGYALHELGHAWYTDNQPWDAARSAHGKFVSDLINGLEDPRIEKLVYESGRAPNARNLFENLVSSILAEGYVSPTDKKNIPFLLAIEGRRLNGYSIKHPSITSQSPYAKHLHWALKAAAAAANTGEIVRIAVKLYQRLKDQDEQDEQPQDGKPEDGKPEDGESQDGEPQDGEGNPGEGEGQGEGQGEGKGKGEGKGEGSGSPAPGEGTGDGSDGSQTPSETPSDGTGGGKSFEGGRAVEPSDFIAAELAPHAAACDELYPRPAAGRIWTETFDWN